MAKKEKFSCPHCGIQYDARPDWAGQNAKCKCCKNVFTVPGTLLASVDPRIGEPTQAGESRPLLEADMVGETSSASKTPAPEAEVIVDAELVPFLEPIEEPAAVPSQETYPIASPPVPEVSDPFANGFPFDSELGEVATGTKICRPQPPKMSGKKATQGTLKYLASRPLACLLFLSTFITIYGICFSGISQYRWVDVGICFFVVYVGIRADRGEALNGLLIKIMMYLLVGGSLIASVAFGANVYSQEIGGHLAQASNLLLVAIIASVIFLAILLAFSAVAYLLCRLFGFFRTTASFYSFCNLAFLLLFIVGLSHHPNASTEETVANKRQEIHQPEIDWSPPPQSFNPKPNWQQGEVHVEEANDAQPQTDPLPDFMPNSNTHYPPMTFHSATSKEKAREMLFQLMQSEAFHKQVASNPDFVLKIHKLGQELEKAKGHEVAQIIAEITSLTQPNDKPSETVGTNAAATNPFEVTDSPPANENPFETVDSAPANENPFKTVDSTPVNKNPFATADSSGSEESPAGASAPSVKPKRDKPVKLSSVGSVSVDQILDRLNRGSTSSVKRILKSLSRHQPVDEKREAVCRAMIALLENDRLTFARPEVVDTLVDWMTPKVSEDLVKVMKASNDYSSVEMVKQLARVPDGKVATAVVELWTKNPLFLKEAVQTLGDRAEEPLWAVLESSSELLQIDACKFLAQQGTQKSIIKLAELAYAKGKDRAVAEAAESAMKALIAKKGK